MNNVFIHPNRHTTLLPPIEIHIVISVDHPESYQTHDQDTDLHKNSNNTIAHLYCNNS